jgi:hypothetical protein
MSKSKSLKTRFAFVDFQRTEHPERASEEVAELTLRRLRSTKSLTITVKVRQDRWIAIDAREIGRSGWKWEFTDQGRLSGGKTWRDLITCIYDLDDILSADVSAPMVETARKISRSILVNGPIGDARGVR